jgi:non-homologous end joining protein Ku
MSTRALWKGVLKIRALTIPVRMVSANAAADPAADVAMHTAHRCTKRRLTRITKPTWCPHCAAIVTQTVRAVEYADGQLAEISGAELKACAADDSNVMNAIATPKFNTLSPALIDSTNYLLPDGAAGAGLFQAIREVLIHDANNILIADAVINDRLRVVAIQPAMNGALFIHTLRPVDKARVDFDDEDLYAWPSPSHADVQHAKQLLSELTQTFDYRRAIRDTYAGRLRALLKKKLEPLMKKGKRASAAA